MGLSYIGVNIFMSYERYGDIVSYLQSVLPAFILLGVAVLLFLFGAIGMFAIFSENRCLLSLVTIASIFTIFCSHLLMNNYVFYFQICIALYRVDHSAWF